jgi:hypothetical protein
LETETDRRFFRIVVGCYSHREGHWSARDDLRANGLQDHQMCSLGSRRALMGDEDGNVPDPSVEAASRGQIRYDMRRVRELEIHVSSASLFDRLWPAPHDHDGSLTRWMTPGQSSIVWRKLREDCPLLMVSADTAQQQLQSVQVQFRHGPTVVQAFNFAV